MSFSSNVKQELCRLPISRRQEAAAELYGILLYCNAFTAELIRITTESRDLADRLPRLMKKVAGFSFDQEPEAEETGKLVFTVDSQEKIHKIFAQFGLSAAKDVTLHVNYGILEEDEERLAFLRGAFLSDKSFHLSSLESKGTNIDFPAAGKARGLRHCSNRHPSYTNERLLP